MKKRMLKQIGVIAMSAVLAMPTTGVYAKNVQQKEQTSYEVSKVQDRAVTSNIATSGTCGKNAKWSYSKKTKTLRISGRGRVNDDDFSFQIPWYSIIQSQKIKKVVIEEGITNVPYSAFWQCTSLTSVKFPSTLKEIGKAAFDECSSLKSVTIPKSVEIIGERAFAKCSSLQNIKVEEENAVYKSVNGNLCSKNGKRLIFGCAKAKVKIPDKVTIIEEYAFEGHNNLKSVSIPSSVKTIGFSAFRDCTRLKSIAISSSTTKIIDCAGTGYPSFNVLSSSKNVTIYGKKASKAEKYAKKYNIPFKSLNKYPDK